MRMLLLHKSTNPLMVKGLCKLSETYKPPPSAWRLGTETSLPQFCPLVFNTATTQLSSRGRVFGRMNSSSKRGLGEKKSNPQDIHSLLYNR